MKIEVESDITGSVALALREAAKLTQREFWAIVGADQASGSRYEMALVRIPRAVRILIFINYVAGLRIDTSTKQGTEDLFNLVHMREKSSNPPSYVVPVWNGPAMP